jgi:hypothetical protein
VLGHGEHAVEQPVPRPVVLLEDADDRPATATVAAGAPASFTVTNTPQQNFGTLQITKTIGGAGGVASRTTFSGSYDCGTGFSGPFSGLTPTAPVTIPNIPVGRSCTVTETTPTGGLVDSSYAWDVTGTVNPAAVTIANGQTATSPSRTRPSASTAP